MMDLQKIYKEHPDFFKSGEKFSTYLQNGYPEEKGKRYVLVIMFQEGVMNVLKSENKLAAEGFINRLVNSYGFDPTITEECYRLFAELKLQPKNSSTVTASNSKTATHSQQRYPKFSENYIRSLLASPKFFIRGRSYFQNGRVHNLSFNADKTLFESDVDGSRDNSYHCTLRFSGNKLSNSLCECPANAEIPGPCKHIVATMLKISEEQMAEMRTVISEPNPQKTNFTSNQMSLDKCRTSNEKPKREAYPESTIQQQTAETSKEQSNISLNSSPHNKVFKIPDSLKWTLIIIIGFIIMIGIIVAGIFLWESGIIGGIFVVIAIIAVIAFVYWIFH